MSPTSYLTAPPRAAVCIYSTAHGFVKEAVSVLRWRENMIAILVIIVFASAFLALLAGISALRAGLRLRRTRAVLQSRLFSDVADLAGRATELEENLATLNARAQALPVRISELQQNLATLGILTNALGTSLRQAQNVLSASGIRSTPSGTFQNYAEEDSRTPEPGQDQSPQP